MRSSKVDVPFAFVLDALWPLEISVRKMFGCHALYRDNMILLVLRERSEYIESNGIWIATSKEHHESLRQDLPAMKSIAVFGRGVSNWQMIGSDEPEFEELGLRVCEMVKKKDPRIGRIPKPRRPQKAPKRPRGR